MSFIISQLPFNELVAVCNELRQLKNDEWKIKMVYSRHSINGK
jgi:hypothetical protein